jgi:hypothetical protein
MWVKIGLVVAAALLTGTHDVSFPVPSQTPSPLIDTRHYWYQGRDNDPRKHPVPPEYQTGPPTPWHIRCTDWYRSPVGRTLRWTYYVTTCESWNPSTIRVRAPKPASTPS